VWSFFAPDEHPELHELFGDEFKLRYEHLEREGKFRSQMPAKDLWRKMMTMLFETGHPWITFKDECNRRNPQQHVGVVHSSNLCTEITLNTNDNETAVCNLGSINAARHVLNGTIDHVKLKRTITTAMRMLDNVIDINFYPSSRAKNSNLQHRPVGLGLMGLTDMMCQIGIDWESQDSLDLQDELFEAISFHGIMASADLAQERGAYPSFTGSLWYQGVLPIDTANENAIALTADRAHSYDWEAARVAAMRGMRNSNIMAIAPTATIANITGVVPSIESPYELSYTKSNLSGQFLVVTSALQYGFPVKAAFDVDQLWSIKAAGVRQKWICQSQSLNIFVPADIKGSKLSGIYKKARFYGCKTTYYLRRKVVETEDAGAPDAVRQAEVVPEMNVSTEQEGRFCSITAGPDCESCQ
jgi:ribonucleoside-diphosphate reductase alpha chain